MKLNINYHNLLDIINLNFNVYDPVQEFVSKKDFLSIVKNFSLLDGTFFPMPIFMDISKDFYKKSKDVKFLRLFFKSKRVCNLNIKSFYKVDKKVVGKEIFKTTDLRHPGLNKFLKSGDYFIHGKISNFNNQIMKKFNFSYPNKIKRNIKKKKLKTIVGFHTRNVPHKAHEWIHNFALTKCEGLLIQPLIGQFKKNEYKEKIIIKTNKKLVNSVYKKKNILFALLNSYPRYAGPREALLHSIIRRNYGCSHFMLGRDHAGVGNFYAKYASQNMCKRYEKKMKIGIIAFNEPYICSSCNKIVNKSCKRCFKITKKFISGTSIRKLIKKKRDIPNIYMRKSISRILNPRSII